MFSDDMRNSFVCGVYMCMILAEYFPLSGTVSWLISLPVAFILLLCLQHCIDLLMCCETQF
jgi:hypothetical protein